jgi:hypothetical protein
MNQSEIEKQRLISKLKQDNDIVMADDGFYCYWPDGAKGFLTSNNLRIIADYLDEENKLWQNNIDNYFSKKEIIDRVRLDPLGFNE